MHHFVFTLKLWQRCKISYLKKPWAKLIFYYYTFHFSLTFQWLEFNFAWRKSTMSIEHALHCICIIYATCIVKLGSLNLNHFLGYNNICAQNIFLKDYGAIYFMNSIKHFHTYINANVKLARIMSTTWTQISSHIFCVCQRSTFYNFFGKGAANKTGRPRLQRQKQIQLAFMAEKLLHSTGFHHHLVINRISL